MDKTRIKTIEKRIQTGKKLLLALVFMMLSVTAAMSIAAVADAFAVTSASAVVNGAATWGGRDQHPAVVNPVCGEVSSDVLSLRGKWTFTRNVDNVPHRNGAWRKVYKDDWSGTREIEVPSCWEAQGVGEPGMGEGWDLRCDNSEKPIRHKYMGEGWYRKEVDIPFSWAGKRIWIKFGGVKSVGWVWVNDRQVALIDNYCATFLDDAWIRGDFDRQEAEVHVEVSGCGSQTSGHALRVTVEDEVREVQLKHLGTQALALSLRGFRPWSPEHPNLYTGLVELIENGRVVQRRKERFGVRKFEARGKGPSGGDSPTWPPGESKGIFRLSLGCL